MKRAMFIINPSSGKEEAPVYKELVIEALSRMGFETELRETAKEGDATRFAADACKNEFDFVMAMGGDGTINESVAGLAEQSHKPLFSFIPLGTVNDFARALGISLDPEEAIAALETGVVKKVDIAKAGERYFMNILALGALAEATYHVTPEQKTKLGTFAYLLEGLKALTHDEETYFEIEHDQGRWEGEAKLVLAALTNSVGGFERLAPDAQPDDGLLHLYIVKNAALPAFIRMAGELVIGRLEHDPSVDVIHAKSVSVKTKEPLDCNIDGEAGFKTPFTIEVLPKHIEVLVPPEKAE
ncbi:diacylglycerol/lipid kinase family protein [Planococcus lenghuensis]|uniref:Diacylglycerol kinase n=1 Tax=Planococcus lenghuensis TaxID=2213202 RepID=A0A1Q2KV85_9BACL|nr:YegS/Rv2252/BmrU family lipid kinase [Planococcus lenghuensis]AQQ52111.1 diacylglycerol kinase [Planococcus lenghuensis]